MKCSVAEWLSLDVRGNWDVPPSRIIFVAPAPTGDGLISSCGAGGESFYRIEISPSNRTDMTRLTPGNLANFRAWLARRSGRR
jgi:hypothetical protein